MNIPQMIVRFLTSKPTPTTQNNANFIPRLQKFLNFTGSQPSEYSENSEETCEYSTFFKVTYHKF